MTISDGLGAKYPLNVSSSCESDLSPGDAGEIKDLSIAYVSPPTIAMKTALFRASSTMLFASKKNCSRSAYISQLWPSRGRNSPMSPTGAPETVTLVLVVCPDGPPATSAGGGIVLFFLPFYVSTKISHPI